MGNLEIIEIKRLNEIANETFWIIYYRIHFGIRLQYI